MRTDGLSFDRIPALTTPLGFFTSAALFGVLAGVLLLIDPALLQSRWQGTTLALTHLISLGFGGHIMLGALYQVLPVVGGEPIPHSPRLAMLIRGGLTVGTLALASGFLWRDVWLFGLAVAALGSALAAFAGGFGTALLRSGAKGETVKVLRLAALALLVATALGGYQALSHALPKSVLFAPTLTTLHLQWAGLGWVVLLVIGVSLQVIPMFHVTPAFPGWITNRLAPALFVLLILASFPVTAGAASIGALLLVGIYSITGLRLLARRKRKRLDYTVQFWRLGLLHLLLVCVVLAADLLLGDRWNQPVLIGVVFGAGFLLSIIFGMQLKIMPFLIYLHLQRRCLDNPMALMQLPHMGDLLPQPRAARLWQLHLLLLAALYLSLLPGIAAVVPTVAGAIAAVTFGWLWWSLRQAQALYHWACQQIATA